MPLSDERIRARLERLEVEARLRPRRHAVRLVCLVLAGYAYPMLLLAGSLGLVVGLLAAAPSALSNLPGQGIIIYIVLLIGALVLAASMAWTFMVTLPLPQGQVLDDADAPDLRALVEEARRAASCRAVSALYIDLRCNAAVAQRRRFGLWGRKVNYLIIGLPLLLLLTPEQIRAVLAHEFAHLRCGHSAFSAWIYRVFQTWESLGTTASGSGRLRYVVIGWFAKRYGERLARGTLPLRRLHEYAADRESAERVGAPAAASVLAAIDLGAYRLEHVFWPGIWRESAQSPLPPSDVFDQMARFFEQPAATDVELRWRVRESRARTPITSEHPCLGDRLAAIGGRSLLEEESSAAENRRAASATDSAVGLLGECRGRVWRVANASWKALTISKWREEHAAACRAMEKVKAAAARAADAATDCWEEVQLGAWRSQREDAIAALRAFTDRHPQHAGANFELGRLLIDVDDAEAVARVEAAMRGGSEFIAPGLQLMLDHYRGLGEDDLADPIAKRLSEHVQALGRARAERLTASKRDRFEPHGLLAGDLENVRRVLWRFPQVDAAWMVRKQVREFVDKPGYVLAVRRKSSVFEDRRRADKFLIECLQAQMPVSCAVVLLGWRHNRLESRILRECPEPVFTAMRMAHASDSA